MREKVLEVLCEVNGNISKNADADFLASSIIDSIDIVNIVVGLEDAFDIEIDADFVIPENFNTLDNIVSMIEKIMKQR